MGMCEMCGSDTKLLKTDLEGAILNVCKECSKFGKVISSVRDPALVKKFEKKRKQFEEKNKKELVPEIIQVVVENYSELIKAKREKQGMTQELLAKKLAEKESIIHKLESGTFIPSISLARKIENHLRIKLIEEIEDKKDKKYVSKSGSLTIGDILNIQK